jgi:hypothetical protein
MYREQHKLSALPRVGTAVEVRTCVVTGLIFLPVAGAWAEWIRTGSLTASWRPGTKNLLWLFSGDFPTLLMAKSNKA